MSKRPKRKGAGQIDRFSESKHSTENRRPSPAKNDGPPPHLLRIREHGDGFRFDKLEVRKATRQGNPIGTGVFATENIKRNTYLLVLGKLVDKKTVLEQWSNTRASHSIPIIVDDEVMYIDGKPIKSNHPNADNVAFWGLSITNLINEPEYNVKPNCFMDAESKSILVQKDIRAGDELTMYYGKIYPREEHKYPKPYPTTDKNRWRAPGMRKWAVPASLNAEFDKWMAVISTKKEQPEMVPESPPASPEMVPESPPASPSTASMLRFSRVLSEVTRRQESFVPKDFRLCKNCFVIQLKTNVKCSLCGRTF